MTTRTAFAILSSLALATVLRAGPATAGIAQISAHGKTFEPTAEIPVFADAAERTKVVVRGPLLDLATGVSSSDSRYSVSLGRRIAGGNSSIEVLVGVSDAVPDGDESTLKIHFLAGEERLRVKTFRSRIDRMEIEPPRAGDRFLRGEKVILLLHGQGLDHVDSKGAAAVMLRAAAGNLCKVEGPLAPGSTATRAAFQLELTGAGTLSVTRDWFRDARHQSPVGEALVRGNPRSVRLTIEARPPARAATCRLTGGGARTPLALLDVRLRFDGKSPVMQLAAGQTPPRPFVDILSNGSGHAVVQVDSEQGDTR